MAKLVFVWQVLALSYTGLHVSAEERQKEFHWLVAQDGKMCEDSETLFTIQSPSLLACSVMCADNEICASLFYREANSSCVGCAEIYLTDPGLHRVHGTKYLYDPYMVTTTTSSTSTSTTSSTTSTTTTPTTTSTTSTTTSTTTSSTSTTTTTAKRTTSSDSEWKYFDGHLYKLEQELADYDGAVAKCQSQGAHLAHIESAEENEFVGKMVGNVETGNYKIYLGATDRASEGNWRWEDDNSQLTYHNWRGGSAHVNVMQHCLGMVRDSKGDYEWMDVYCDMDRKFVCKK